MDLNQHGIDQDKLTYQMGLNLRKYQEIEQIFKRIISISSQTFYMKANIRQEVEPELNIWSNQANITKATLGNLLPQLENTKDEPKYQDDHLEDSDLIQASLSYHIPAVAFVDKEKFALDFHQVVQDRNRFIHHFPNESDQNIVLEQLQQEYERAEKFKENHLVPCFKEVMKNIDFSFSEGAKLSKLIFLNFGRLGAYELFDQIYQKYKRPDGWAVWVSMIQEMQKEHPDILSGLRKESSFLSKNTAWTKIVQEAYPNWQFREEDTLKGSKRLLVKVDNSLLNLREEGE